jgi:hypothetical protein
VAAAADNFSVKAVLEVLAGRVVALEEVAEEAEGAAAEEECLEGAEDWAVKR